MKMPLNYEERTALVDKICGMNNQSNLFSFEEILQLKENNLLEEGDLFIMNREDGEFAVVYLDNKWNIITGDNQIIGISDKVLSKYTYYNKNFGDNPLQEFIKRKGQNEFNKLSQSEKCDVYIGNYFINHINDTLDGLINTLEDLNKTLKEIAENG